MNDDSWVIGLFIVIFFIAIVLITMAVFDTKGDRQAYYACTAFEIPADRDLTYMQGIWSNKAVCITQNAEIVNIEEWLND